MSNHDNVCADEGIVVQDDTVLDIDKFDDIRRWESSAPVREFDGIIMPGLINAHTHLELSMFRHTPHKDFVDWVLDLMDLRASLVGQDSKDQCLNTKREAEEHGTAYFVNVGNDYEMNHSFGRNQLFEFEQLGINNSNAGKVFERSLSYLKRENDGVETALAVHSPYSVSPALMKKIKGYNNKRGTVTSIHLAETPDEVAFIRTGKGRIADLLNARVGKWKFDVQNLSPVKYIDSLGILDRRTLCVHCVFVDEDDLKLLAERGSAVAFCVRSNEELSGRTPDLKKFLVHRDPSGKNVIKVLLGTDSKASSPDIDMFSEMAAFYNLYHDIINPADVFRMATSDAADFLGLGSRYGRISPGSSAALVYAPFDGKAEDVFEFLMTDGKSKARTIHY